MEHWDLIRWRGAVASAIRGKRGQAFLRELLEALDSMPNKRLILDDLRDELGEVCALGVIVESRGLDIDTLDSSEHEQMSNALGIAKALVKEVEWENDEGGCNETPAARWVRIRAWVSEAIS